MYAYHYRVTVNAPSRAEADMVMAERLDYDEQYYNEDGRAFLYTIGYSPLRWGDDADVLVVGAGLSGIGREQGGLMPKYFQATVHLSNDLRRTCMFVGDDDAEKAALDGCYDGMGHRLYVWGDNVLEALNAVYAITNSYPEELNCDQRYAYDVGLYRQAGKRSLSVGDMVVIRNVQMPSEEDGRYVVASVGFERVQARVA